MKRLTFSLFLVFFAQIVNAQLPMYNLKNLGLKGKVKEVIDLDYTGEINKNIVDTAGKYFKTIIKFDLYGNQTESISYDEDGKLLTKSVFDYSIPKKIIVNQHPEDSRLSSKYIFILNDKGEPIGCDSYENNIINDVVDTLFLKYIFKYDTSGNKIEEDTKDKYLGYLGKEVFLYDKKSQIIEKDGYNSDGFQYYKTLYEYDQFGNQIKNEGYKLPANELVGGVDAVYDKIDKDGNWHLKSSQEKFKPGDTQGLTQKFILKRTIIYYE